MLKCLNLKGRDCCDTYRYLIQNFQMSMRNLFLLKKENTEKVQL